MDCITHGVWDCREDYGTCPDSFVDEEVCIMPDADHVIYLMEESNDLMGLRITYRHKTLGTDYVCTMGDWSSAKTWVSAGYDVKGIRVCYDGGRALAMEITSDIGGIYPLGDWGKCSPDDVVQNLPDFLSGFKIRYASSPTYEISAVIPVERCPSCIVSTLTAPLSFGPFTQTVNQASLTTPVYTFTPDCSEVLTYTYTVTDSSGNDVTVASASWLTHDSGNE